jgi:hypothetical protein
MILTKEIATQLKHKAELYSRAKTQGGGKQPKRVRVNGSCKTWKTRPTEFRLPVNHGMYEYDYITDLDASNWDTDQDEAWAAIQEQVAK